MKLRIRLEGLLYGFLFTVVWLATLHFGFDLGRAQGLHGFFHDAIPAAMGLGFVTAWFAEQLEEAAHQRAEIAKVLHDMYMKDHEELPGQCHDPDCQFVAPHRHRQRS